MEVSSDAKMLTRCRLKVGFGAIFQPDFRLLGVNNVACPEAQTIVTES